MVIDGAFGTVLGLVIIAAIAAIVLRVIWVVVFQRDGHDESN